MSRPLEVEDERPLLRQVADLAVARAFRHAHRGRRAWWWLRRPRTHGALVAVWVQGRVLVLRNGYRDERNFPGGFISSGEDPVEAAVRELREETTLVASVSELREDYAGVLPYENRDDACTIFALEREELPPLRLDHREVVGASLLTPARALELPLIPHVRQYLFMQRA